jgi:hypothetical protein
MEKAWLSTTGKKKGKQKFRTAEAANRARQAKESWNEILEKYDAKVVVEKPKQVRAGSSKNLATYRTDWRSRVDPNRLTDHIPSRDTGCGVAARPADKVYTGDAMIGIGQLHKSNGIPVFRQEDAVDVSKMRRG